MFALASIWLSANCSLAADRLVLATGEMIPYASKTRDNYGIWTEMVTAVVEEMGMEPVYEWYPWKRCYEYVKNGDIWASFLWTYTDERAAEVDFSEAVYPDDYTSFFYYNTKPIIAVKSPEDLKSLTIGGIRGYFYESLFQKAGLNFELVSNDEQNFHKLVAGRVDLITITQTAGWYYIKKLYPDKADRFGTMYFPWPLKINKLSGARLIVSRNYPKTKDLLRQFNDALERIKKNGTYNRILEQQGIKP
jgi:polar amino acid transport system substrate-binding protein